MNRDDLSSLVLASPAHHGAWAAGCDVIKRALSLGLAVEGFQLVERRAVRTPPTHAKTAPVTWNAPGAVCWAHINGQCFHYSTSGETSGMLVFAGRAQALFSL
jgi:hypothetical protein